MKKLVATIGTVILILSSPAAAHVANEKTIYDDILFSEAQEEIVYLRGLNVVTSGHGVSIFQPREKLARADLAFWAAAFHQLGGHDAAAEQLQQAALAEGLVDSLEGDATYEDVNQAYFNRQAPSEKTSETITREEFALFMGQFLTDPVAGQTLFDMAGYQPGPAGTITKVTFEMEGEGEAAYKVFRFTIDGRDYAVSQHPKVLYGPVDLSVWEGKTVEESWLAPSEGGQYAVHIIKARIGQFSAEGAPGSTGQNNSQGGEGRTAAPGSSESARPFPIVPAVGAAVLFGIIGWLAAKRKP